MSVLLQIILYSSTCVVLYYLAILTMIMLSIVIVSNCDSKCYKAMKAFTIHFHKTCPELGMKEKTTTH